MKFVHIADVHLDMPFKNIGKNGEKRRLDQIQMIRKVVEYINENQIQYLFIAGDFYEHEYIKEGTMNSIINIFKKIPNVHIFISPGNHDPYIQDSIYMRKKFPSNVHIFKKFECIETENANIYGYGFTDFYSEGVDLTNIVLKNNGKKNILVIHADLDSQKKDDKKYNPISSKTLKEIGFDYVALGHIHKTNFKEDSNIIYPGTLMNYRFDKEKSGMVVGEFKENIQYLVTDNPLNDGFRKKDQDKLELKYIEVDDIKYETIIIDITNIKTKEELITDINNMDFNKNAFFKIMLIGKKNFEINERNILDNLNNERIVVVETALEFAIDLDEISKENTLRGIFVRHALEKMKQAKKEEDIEKEKIYEKAIEIAIQEMRN
ncbi:MAG: metallophosphoesterase family protein [Clostridium sp.]